MFALFLVVPLVWMAVKVIAPFSDQILNKTAVLSVMMGMPEGTLEYVQGMLEEMHQATNPSTSATEDLPPSSSTQGQVSQSETSSSVSQVEKEPKPVDEAYKGVLLSENMAGSDRNTSLIKYGNGYIKNYTNVTVDQIKTLLQTDYQTELDGSEGPQVLIYHTHATESYEPYDCDYYDMRNTWRNTDDTQNMVAVGNALAEELEKAGIEVIHDTTQHDYPSYNGSYDRSRETINKYLEQYPSIKVTLDVHRDGIEREKGVIVKPVAEIDGKKAAQLMIIAPCDDGTMNIPNWEGNLRFAAALQDALETDYPTVTRPIFFCYRKYNLDVTVESLLLEVGSNANTLEESVYTAQLIGKSLAKILLETQK